MKAFALGSLLLLFSFTATAKICSTGCVTGTSGSAIFATGYAWEQPNDTVCGKGWLAAHIHTTIYYADAVGSGGNAVIVDQGTCDVVDIAC